MINLICVDFVILLLKNIYLQEKTNLFSANDYKKNDKIMNKYFKDKYVKSRIQTKKN